MFLIDCPCTERCRVALGLLCVSTLVVPYVSCAFFGSPVQWQRDDGDLLLHITSANLERLFGEDKDETTPLSDLVRQAWASTKTTAGAGAGTGAEGK